MNKKTAFIAGLKGLKETEQIRAHKIIAAMTAVVSFLEVSALIMSLYGASIPLENKPTGNCPKSIMYP